MIYEKTIDMFTEIPSNSILVSYHGSFNMQTIDELLKSIRVKLEEQSIDKRSIKSIYSISVECLENIMKHGKSIDNKPVVGKFAFSFLGGKLCFLVANHISTEDKEKLEQKLQTIDNLSLDKIKEIYKHDLVHGQISDRGGAGLGMYVMAMKSNKNFYYQFSEAENDHLFYSLKVDIDLATAEA